MEVNEKIVEEYIKSVKGWFYMTDISFPVPSNYSNIDLLAYDHKNDEYYDLEIKYRSAYHLTLNDERLEQFIYQMTRPERQEKLEEIIGKGKNLIKVFVTTRKHFGKSDDIGNHFIKTLKGKGFKSEIWYFDDIIPELYDTLDKKGHYNTELTQTIRLIKTYVK
jgi:hypothetical protein